MRLGKKRIKLFSITLEGKEIDRERFVYRLGENFKNKTEIKSFFFSKKEKIKENEQQYELFFDLNYCFDINLKIFTKHIMTIFSKIKRTLVTITDFEWIESVIANYDDMGM